MKDTEQRKVMLLADFVKEVQQSHTIKEIHEHAFSIQDGGIKLAPRRQHALKIRANKPVLAEFLDRVAGSAMFGICPGAAFKEDKSELKVHGICIYNKKEIIVDKSGVHKVSLAA